MRKLIKIGDIVLSGSDAERFCLMSDWAKVEYVQRIRPDWTNEKINKALGLASNVLIGCCGQSFKPVKDGGDITGGNEPQIEQVDASEDTGIDVSGNQGGRVDIERAKGPRVHKGAKAGRKTDR